VDKSIPNLASHSTWTYRYGI